MKKTLIILIWVLIGITLLVFIFIGSKNKSDPFWSSLDTLIVSKNIYCLEEKFDVIDSAYRTYQKDTELQKVSSFEFISKPFLPIYEYHKFLNIIDYFYKNKIMIVSGVTGSSKTTIIDRAAKLMAASPERILHLQCVEKMEVELHKQWIGYQTEDAFRPGKLLKFFEKCRQDTLHNFVFIIDDIDKIYPATFFGAPLWNELDNPSYNNSIEGYTDDLTIPPNFYMLAVTHSGAGSTVELNFEHYRRLGNNVPYVIPPDYIEFFLYMKTKFENKENIYKEKKHIKKLLYFFIKANEYIEKNYGQSYMIGQWTAVRKYLEPENFDDFVNCFLENVNTFSPEVPLSKADFKPIFYSIENDGLLIKTNFLDKSFKAIIKTGVFSEITVAILFALITAIISIIMFRKKRKFINELVCSSNATIKEFESNKISYDESRGRLLIINENIDKYIIKRKINFTEANYLLTTISHQLKKIEDINKLNQASLNLREMFNRFTADGELDKKEHNYLIQFLDGIKSTISTKVYNNLKTQIDDTFRKSFVTKK